MNKDAIVQICRDYMDAKKFDNVSAREFSAKLQAVLEGDLQAFADEWGLDNWEAKSWLNLTDAIPALRDRIDKGRKYSNDLKDQLEAGKRTMTTEEKAETVGKIKRAKDLLWTLGLDLMLDEAQFEHVQQKMNNHIAEF